jgi:hypothetical protein
MFLISGNLNLNHNFIFGITLNCTLRFLARPSVVALESIDDLPSSIQQGIQ